MFLRIASLNHMDTELDAVDELTCGPPYGFFEQQAEHEADFFLWPVFRCFQHKPFHIRHDCVRLDLTAVIKANAAQLYRSKARPESAGVVGQYKWGGELLFRLDEAGFVYLRDNHVRVFAPTAKRAEAMLKDLKERFTTKEPPPVASFHLLSVASGTIQSEKVAVEAPFVMAPADLALNYGDDFPAWVDQLVGQLTEKKCGLTILHGEPGTGKTSLLRHLLNRLVSTHSCYVIPATHFGVLSDPCFVSYWAIPTGKDKRKPRRIVFIEDADGLLEKRHADNRERVSNLLNIADGFLGEFLQVHIIATVNCAFDKLDPAIRRKGRLLAYRQFRRLTRAEAQRLAASKGITLPEQTDYSLAEIYNAATAAPEVPQETAIGFRR